MAEFMMNKSETDVKIGARPVNMFSASLEETENESSAYIEGEIESGDIHEEWRRMMNELDLAASDIVHSMSKAEEIREEAERTLELMVSERVRWEGETHDMPTVGATANSPTDKGEEGSNADLAPEEAEEQAEKSGDPTVSEIDQVEAVATRPLSIQRPPHMNYECKSCGRSFELPQRLAFHERTHASAQATPVAQQPAEATPTVAQTPPAGNDGEGNVAELAPEKVEEDDPTFSKIVPDGVAPPEESRVEPTLLELCMSNPRFRARVISKIARKIR